MIRILTPLLLIILFLLAIAYEQQPVPSLSGDIDEALLPYARKFVEEGKKRGVRIDLSELTLVFTDEMIEIKGQSFCGYAYNFGNDQAPYVEIALSCWKDYSIEQREILVFHELGHAILQRPHRDDQLPSGSLASLMNSLNTVNVYDRYTLPKRDFYLDELFNIQSERLPSWAAARSDFVNWYLEPYLPADTSWQFKTQTKDTASYGEISMADAATRAYALKIEVPEDQPLEAPAFWRFIKSHPKIPEGAKVILKARLCLDDVEGPGIALAVRGENFLAGEAPLNVSTRKDEPITGDFCYRDVELVLTDYFPHDVNALYVYLMMLPGTTGTAWFDEVRLEQQR